MSKTKFWMNFSLGKIKFWSEPLLLCFSPVFHCKILGSELISAASSASGGFGGGLCWNSFLKNLFWSK